MASVRQRDEDMSRTQRPREWPVRNESALSQRRPSEADSRGSSSKSMLGRSYSAGATGASQRDIRHIPKLSISSENGELIDITNVDMRLGVHQSQHPTLHKDKHSGASNVARRDEAVVDMAMEIAEEVSLMCATPRPVDTDEPFVTVGLNADGARRLEGWLYARFDSYSSAARLMDKNITAEALAVEIIGEICLAFALP
ncbi:hypothetical protein EIP86_003781 [Pleurotus ostreatoroseus]|nr:hypothetical protein EIP86_003781 [Pleurotus ostreatoroseus]